MTPNIAFDADLIRRYDQSGPRYTSYPTAAQFHGGISDSDYRKWATHSNEDPIPRPLSLYLHIPFCDTVCFYCACNKVATKDRTRSQPYLDRVHREMAMQGELFDNSRPVEQLRRFDLQQLLLWHGRRALDGFWGKAAALEPAWMQ